MPGHIESAAAHDIFLQMKLAQEEKQAASIKSSNSIKTSTESIKSVAASQKTKVEGSPLVFETATPQLFQSRFFTRDTKVLDAIFSQDFSGLAQEENPTTSNLNPNKPSLNYPLPTTETLAQLQILESKGVAAAESNDLESALSFFSSAIDSWPWHPSALNNRAQTLRMLGRDADAMRDINDAIEYALAQQNEGVLKMAYAQRAILRKNEGNMSGAEEDLLKAAKLGNETARAAVKNNPYAKMCNAMVSELMAQYAPNKVGGSGAECNVVIGEKDTEMGEAERE
ncbi:hypothetical protein BCR33DRAFT_860352 [Rhizoclosmatium globosum]|uniref:Uncharacterized protein n=1 Tax=Rhizoclosmatium globosum TaxID=329046 RepID=A0A1Y2AQP4_9FUNG|nr:hypothetical protein BCR33DRAFT_860352 [Rhizoclosmatium globosum]|eukprot:ORY24275.1 hypothetical protein BCR33DRAFT_860352 [Rhizoclosmatium globosum]